MTDGFQPATAEQADELERVYRAAAVHTNEQGVPQWLALALYHRERTLRDIAAEDLFVLVRSGKLAGTVAVNRSLEVARENAAAEWKGALPFGVLHRLCINPRLQGQGLGRELLRSAETLAFERSYRSSQPMVLDNNRFALGLYAKVGFAPRGQFLTDFGCTFVFMENNLSR